MPRSRAQDIDMEGTVATATATATAVLLAMCRQIVGRTVGLAL